MFNSPKYRRFLVIAYSIIIHGMAPSDSFKYQFEIKKKRRYVLNRGFQAKLRNIQIYIFTSLSIGYITCFFLMLHIT